MRFHRRQVVRNGYASGCSLLCASLILLKRIALHRYQERSICRLARGTEAQSLVLPLLLLVVLQRK